MVSVFMEKISVVIPETLLCEDIGMAAVLNRWMAIIMRPQTLPGLEAKFGLKPKHRRFGEWLTEEVSNLISRGDVLSYEMAKIVREENRGGCYRDVKVSKDKA